MRLDLLVKEMSLHVSPFTISTHQRQLCFKLWHWWHVCISTASRKNDQFLEQEIEIKFFCEIKEVCKNENWRWNMKQPTSRWSKKAAGMSKSQMKIMLITFFDVKDVEYIPQGDTVKHAYYMEILKWLH
jgi:hypothetical protein